MKEVAGNLHLIRRKGVYYFRRRVPQQLVKPIGQKFIQISLGTKSHTQAKQLRARRDIEWDARFEAAEKKLAPQLPEAENLQSTAHGPVLSEREVLKLVQDHINRLDEKFRKRFESDPPESEEVRADMRMEASYGSQVYRDRDDPHADQSVSSTADDILKSVGKSLTDLAVPPVTFWEWVRRGLLELSERNLARIEDRHQQPFFDPMFNPSGPSKVGFGELADQFMKLAEEDKLANRLSQKWIDKQRANVTLLLEIIGSDTPVHAIDYDACLNARSMLARIPANRTKIYKELSLEQAAQKAVVDNKSLLSPTTQQQYLGTLRDMLDLAVKKRIIPANSAEGLKPVKRDTVPTGEKRLPFTPLQIRQFFETGYYSECAKHPVPFEHGKTGWRFWLPLMCLFMGMRPNEAAQMHVDDLKCTNQGTWYLDIIATADDDEDGLGNDSHEFRHHSERKCS